jgi:imidazole glycerol phosphate synthase glutamine amidotransferase subunit
VIALVDYGGGNTGSVLKALRFLGCEARVTGLPAELAAAEKVILPGQGHFRQMMQDLESTGLRQPLLELLQDGKPFLGICLGLQALYESSEEAPGVAGFGLLRGQVRRFQGIFKIPHVGWSQLEFPQPSPLFQGIAPGSFVYYCHSYYGPLTAETIAATEYGQRFAAAASIGNIYAVQFHPEKSGAVGLSVLRNFLAM